MIVQVYRNLRTGNWSIRHDRRILLHATDCTLENCKLHVFEKGRQRVIHQRQKNVHAFISGTLALRGANLPWKEITYNPYLNSFFVFRRTNEPVPDSVSMALFAGDNRCFVVL